MNNTQLEKEFLKQVNENQQIIHKICFVYACGYDEKQDLKQEIVLQLWRSYRSFSGRSAFSTWMYRVALNTAISQTRRPSIFRDASIENHTTTNIEKDMDYSEDVRILYKAIANLKKIDKAIVLLWLEENSYAEIADTVGISVKNVSVKLVRIKVTLAEIIKKLH